MGNRAGVLSKASPYEARFGTRQRPIGRPSGDTEPLFASAADLKGIDPLIVSVAKRRAYSVVHEEQRERLREVFLAELGVLKRRGVDVVAEDSGYRSGYGERSAD